MDFLDNVMKSSNALLKERLNNPFGGNRQPQQQQPKQDGDQQTAPPPAAESSNTTTTTNDQPELSASQSSTSANIPSNNDQTRLTGGDNQDRMIGGDKNSQFAAIAADVEAVTQKTVKGAKNIGSFLFSMANKAGQTVSQTAKQVKQAVESTSILTDLTREQQEFIREHGGSMQSGELPWADCKNEAKSSDIREQILSLSQDKRNFVRNPPNDANFQFDPEQCYPIALSLLKEDPNLSKMRFELVPKLVSEDTFWCNYFYRVSLLKQMSDRGEDIKRQGWASSRSSSGEGPDEVTANDVEVNQGDDAKPSYSTTTNTTTTTAATTLGQEEASFNLNITAINPETQELESSESRKLVAEADDLKSKLRELNIGSFGDDSGGQDENDKWEEELQRDLQEFELVSGDVSALDEEALDKDIMELKQSTKKDID